MKKDKIILFHIRYFAIFILLCLNLFSSCGDSDMIPIDPNPIDTTTVKDITTLDDGPIDFSQLQDTYGAAASGQTSTWAHYNTHDPAYLVDEKFTYSYSTDASFGQTIRPGIQIRRSINLVEWEFVGWALPIIPVAASNFIIENGGKPNDGLWAPYVIKVGGEYRLYYSLASNKGRLSAIGLATSTSPKGPFREKGLVVTSKEFGGVQTNAIDPTIVSDPSGNQWMYYGSAWDGIYKLELNKVTGLAERSSDVGTRVASRGVTNGIANGNIEGAEAIYNKENGMYYLFIAYDWLQTKYNVRVGRSQNPNGPFYDYFGNDVNKSEDHAPMILAPYKFSDHGGWQGVSHCGVFSKGNNYYIGHQGRPGVNSFYMVMHTRQLFWTEDGWPLVSSQRYAGEIESDVANAELIGKWDWIDFTYKIVPGYDKEQTNADFGIATSLTLDAAGSVNNDDKTTWTYQSPWLVIKYENGEQVKLRVERGRDWERNKDNTILVTGYNKNAYPIWGKKLD